MSVTNFVNLSNSLPGQSAAQHAQPSALPANPAVTSGTSALPKDQFVPSAWSETTDATAQAAGLFTVSKSASSSSSSDLLSTPSSAAPLATSSATKTNPATAAIGAATATADSALPPASPATSDSATVTGSAASSDSAQATSTTASSSAASSVSPSRSVTTQTQLDSLNNALQALGLSAADIQQVDQVAQLTNDFSPTSFTSLVYQLEALARNSAPQTQTPPTANANASSNNAAAQPFAATSPSNGTAPNAQTASGGESSSNHRNLSLQSAQLQLNFTNGDGQSVQVQTPVLNSNSVPAVAKTQAATA